LAVKTNRNSPARPGRVVAHLESAQCRALVDADAMDAVAQEQVTSGAGPSDRAGRRRLAWHYFCT
jgi:hypothetical protein